MMNMDNEEIKEKVYKTSFKSDTSFDSFKEWAKTDDDGTDWMNRLADGLIDEARTSERDKILKEKGVVASFLKEHEANIRQDERAKCIAELEKKDPYPADVFPEPTEMVCWCCRDSPRPIIASGITSDQLHGSWGRQVWNNAISALKEMKDEPR